MKYNTLPNPYSNIPLKYLKFLYTESHRKIKALLQDLTNLYEVFYLSLNFFESEKNLISVLIPMDLQSLIIEKEIEEDNQISKISQINQVSQISDNKRNKNEPEDSDKRCKENNRINCGRKTMLAEEEQRKVGMLCIKCFDSGETITLDRLCNFGKSVAKNSSFTASIGWAQNFLKKHPSIREIYNKSRERLSDSKSKRSNFNRYPHDWSIFQSIPRKIDNEYEFDDVEKDKEKEKINESMNVEYGEYKDMNCSSESLEYNDEDE